MSMITSTPSPQLWVYILAALAIGVLGGVFTNQGINGSTSGWYKSLQRSSLQPPSWFFMVIWTLIYIILAYAAYSGKKTGNGMFNYVFVLNLFLNVLWCYVFFVLNEPGWALIIVALLLLTVLWLIILLWNVDRAAAYWLFIYAGWLLVAMYLNWHAYVQFP